MRAPWEPDFVVDEATARTAIAQAFPALHITQLVPLGAGWDNTAYLVNHAWVFRFPRRAVTVAPLALEMNALPRLAPHLPLAIPFPVYLAAGCAAFARPFAGYALLDGVTACRCALTEAQRGVLAAPLAQFMRALHRLPLALVGDLPMPQTSLDFAALAAREERTSERLAVFGAQGVIDRETRRALSLVVETATPRASPSARAIVHGDLYVRHLIVNHARDITGIIDWGDLQLGDVALDLAVAFTCLPPRAREACLVAYGASLPDERLARVVAVHHALAGLAYATAAGDRDLARETLDACRWLAAA